LVPPTDEDLRDHRIDRFTGTLREVLAEQDLDFFYRLVTRIAGEEELELMDIAAALSFLVQRERPLDTREAVQSGRSRTGPDPREQSGEDRSRKSGGRPRPQRERSGEDGQELARYRIEVGSRDGVSPREIVGAIANEAGLDGRYIGRIEICDDHCTVDLPEGMPREIYRHLRRVYVCGKALKLSLLGADEPKAKGAGPRKGRTERPSGKRPHRGKKGKGSAPG
jgi:ATP-dependent RNA helicase DeaD